MQPLHPFKCIQEKRSLSLSHSSFTDEWTNWEFLGLKLDTLETTDKVEYPLIAKRTGSGLSLQALGSMLHCKLQATCSCASILQFIGKVNDQLIAIQVNGAIHSVWRWLWTFFAGTCRYLTNSQISIWHLMPAPRHSWHFDYPCIGVQGYNCN